MDERNDDTTPATPATTPRPPKNSEPKKQLPILRQLALAFLFFTVSFLGAWAALASGIADGDRSINEKRTAVLHEGEVVADVAERVSPSVVSILTESEQAVGFRSFTRQSAGTGIIISENGYILTNKHVVEGSSNVEVMLADGTLYEDVEVVGADPVNDIAFLKIKNPKNLKAATIGDSSQAEVGEKVIAIGNALGQYQTTVTSGIISGLSRPLVAGDQASGEAERLSNLLQTDAAINPGNSGGPLVNMNGEVIGINTAVDQQAQGIGFAIPINDAKGLIDSIIQTGEVERAFLGVTHLPITAEVAKEFELRINEGAYIYNDAGEAVSPGSPADKAGLKEGDVITKVNGQDIGSKKPLQSAISQHSPGDTITITYVRDGKTSTVKVQLAAFPEQ